MTRVGDSPLEFAVLKRRAEIEAAAEELRRRGLWPSSPRTARRAVGRLRRAIGRPDPTIELQPDPIKSWDILRSLGAITSIADHDEPVLDVGSVASAILPCLHRLGYRRLTGVDLDERVRSMPYAGEIEYAMEDLTRTTQPDASFGAISAVSVIEHGVEEEALLAEVSRLLRPGGIFVFSTDYWPEKIDTSGVSLFGLPWRIFSLSEVDAFLDRAARHGLEPQSDPRPRLRHVEERTVDFAQRSYTFLYGVLLRTQSRAADQ